MVLQKLSDSQKRALDFFNEVKDFEEIIEKIKDDPNFGKPSKQAYGIRKRLAQNILRKREKMPDKKFQSIEQLDSIRGIGKDTMHDIINIFEEELKPTKTVLLKDILEGITSALIKTKAKMDETSIEIEREYAEDQILSNFKVPFYSISEVSLNLRFAIENPEAKDEDLKVLVDTKYLEKLPNYTVSELNLKLSPKKLERNQLKSSKITRS